MLTQVPPHILDPKIQLIRPPVSFQAFKWIEPRVFMIHVPLMLYILKQEIEID